ncbi:MAG: hypothetical protein RMN25_05170 [Anaerolineae bacterium]|nr:hypothetical protein [Thermoflexales bacterium]MDW8407156.1 hypothetical protein [Anaerolineae bacterium]
MARLTNKQKVEQIYHAAQQYPGKKPGFLARLLGLHRSEVTRALPSLEDYQLYLYEDERGRLWPFDPKK